MIAGMMIIAAFVVCIKSICFYKSQWPSRDGGSKEDAENHKTTGVYFYLLMDFVISAFFCIVIAAVSSRLSEIDSIQSDLKLRKETFSRIDSDLWDHGRRLRKLDWDSKNSVSKPFLEGELYREEKERQLQKKEIEKLRKEVSKLKKALKDSQ